MINLFCIRPHGFNVGNDAIYLGLQHFLYQAFGEVVNLISLPATARYQSQAKAGLTAKTIYEINQYGHGVIVGGGNLYENGELDVSVEALGALEVPLLLYSLSRGRIYNRRCELVDRTDALSKNTIAALDRRADFALFRDRATGEYLQRIGCRHTQVGGCPTLFLDRMQERLPWIPEADRGSALVSVRNPSLMSIPPARQSRVYGDVTGVVELLRAAGYRDVRLLCHDHRDLAFAASFPDVEYVYTGDVYSYLAMLRHSAVSVTYRLHAFVPCVSFGRPTIKISYDERTTSLVETIGLGKWNIDMVTSGDVVSDVADRLARLDELTALRERATAAWSQGYEQHLHTFEQFAARVKAYAGGEQPGALEPASEAPRRGLERRHKDEAAMRLLSLLALPGQRIVDRLRKLRALRHMREDAQAHQIKPSTRRDRYPAIFAAVRDYLVAAGLEEGPVLSFGCSTGEECFELRRYLPSARIVGVDLNRWCLRTARRRNGDANLQFLASNPLSIAAHGPYQAIFCMSVLCRWPQTERAVDCRTVYAFERFEECLVQLDGVLANGGVLVLYNANYFLQDTLLARRYRALDVAGVTECGFVTRFRKSGKRSEPPQWAESVFVKLAAASAPTSGADHPCESPALRPTPALGG